MLKHSYKNVILEVNILNTATTINHQIIANFGGLEKLLVNLVQKKVNLWFRAILLWILALFPKSPNWRVFASCPLEDCNSPKDTTQKYKTKMADNSKDFTTNNAL